MRLVPITVVLGRLCNVVEGDDEIRVFVDTTETRPISVGETLETTIRLTVSVDDEVPRQAWGPMSVSLDLGQERPSVDDYGLLAELGQTEAVVDVGWVEDGRLAGSVDLPITVDVAATHLLFWAEGELTLDDGTVETFAAPFSYRAGWEHLLVGVLNSEGGRVVSEPPGINCEFTRCRAAFPLGIDLTLRAEPTTGFQQGPWLMEGEEPGDCAAWGSDAAIDLVMAADLPYCVATFEPIPAACAVEVTAWGEVETFSEITLGTSDWMTNTQVRLEVYPGCTEGAEQPEIRWMHRQVELGTTDIGTGTVLDWTVIPGVMVMQAVDRADGSVLEEIEITFTGPRGDVYTYVPLFGPLSAGDAFEVQVFDATYGGVLDGPFGDRVETIQYELARTGDVERVREEATLADDSWTPVSALGAGTFEVRTRCLGPDGAVVSTSLPRRFDVQ